MEDNSIFFMPAEWERHERTFIAWPVQETLVFPDHYPEVCVGYAQAVKAISTFEPVTLIVNEDTKTCAQTLCAQNFVRSCPSS